jgi:hypothetical protein
MGFMTKDLIDGDSFWMNTFFFPRSRTVFKPKPLSGYEKKQPLGDKMKVWFGMDLWCSCEKSHLPNALLSLVQNSVCGIQIIQSETYGQFHRSPKIKWFIDVYFMPIGSMYGMYANIWGILMVNVTIYSIHGSYGMENPIENPIFQWMIWGYPHDKSESPMTHDSNFALHGLDRGLSHGGETKGRQPIGLLAG